MSPQSKKTTWISAGLISIIFTGFGIAYTAGKWSSVTGHEIEKTNEKIRDVKIFSENTRGELNKHIDEQQKNMKTINIHLHNMDLQLREQTTILREMKGN